MSIVYDYLKQIQQQKGPLIATPDRAGSREKNEKLMPFVAVGVWVLIGLVALGAVYLMIPRATAPAVISVYKPKDRSAGRVAVPGAGYLLEGIIYNPDHPFAIINGQMIEKNGQIDDFVVTAITPNSVSLKNTKDNTGRTLQL